MNTVAAFALGDANRGKPLKVFDWEKAAKLIKERKPDEARAGLSGDWEWTGGSIFAHGQPVKQDDTYTYLASTWATPELDLDGEVFACYKMQNETPEWGANTYWPKEALAILS